MKKLMTLMLAAAFALLARAAEKELRLGVYIYDYAFKRTAKNNGEDFKAFVEKHFRILQEHHVNGIHLTVSGADGQDFREIWLPLMKKYGIKAYLQLDFAYFCIERPFWSEKEEDRRLELAAKFIREFQHEPMIMGFSVREEIPQKHVNSLARFYMNLQSKVPGFKIITLHNNLGAAKDHPVPDPTVLGTDRYCFWWEFSGDGYLASPASALNWLRTDADRYYQEAAKRGADYLFVVTANRYISCRTQAKWQERFKQKPKMLGKVELFSKERRFGWNPCRAGDENLIWFWKYYAPPANCTRAMIWTGILEGAKAVLFYSYSPAEKKFETETPEQFVIRSYNTTKREIFEGSWLTLASRPGVPNQAWEEFAATAEELAPYSRLICLMTKLPDSPVTTDTKKKIFNRAFMIPTRRGKVVILHNANVGAWGHDSRSFFKDSDDIRIDENGNLTGYTPFTGKQEVEFSVKGSAPVFDFASGKEIELSNGKGKTGILPGGGTVLFIGSRQEFERVKAQCAQ